MVGPPMGIIQPASELVVKVRVKQLIDASGKMIVEPFDYKRQRMAILATDLSEAEAKFLLSERGALKEKVRPSVLVGVSCCYTKKIHFFFLQLSAMKNSMSKRARLRLIFDDFNAKDSQEQPESNVQPQVSLLSEENPLMVSPSPGPSTVSENSGALEELEQSRIYIFAAILLLAMFFFDFFLS